MPKWRDETSFSQDDRTRVPRTWVLAWGELRIAVTKYVGYGDEWTLRAPELGYPENVGLKTEDVEEAKRKALEICLKEAQEKSALFTEIISSLERLLLL